MKGRRRASTAIVFLALASGAAGCDGRPPTMPTTKTPVVDPPPSPPAETRVVVFTDPVTGFATSDVRDVDGQIVRFTSAGELIWAADDTRFARFPFDYGYERGAFEVGFASEHGERRAYLTFSLDYWHYPPPASRVDLEIVDGKLVIRHPDPPVFLPGT